MIVETGISGFDHCILVMKSYSSEQVRRHLPRGRHLLGSQVNLRVASILSSQLCTENSAPMLAVQVNKSNSLASDLHLVSIVWHHPINISVQHLIYLP